MPKSRPEDALVKLVKTVETVETVETEGNTQSAAQGNNCSVTKSPG